MLFFHHPGKRPQRNGTSSRPPDSYQHSFESATGAGTGLWSFCSVDPRADIEFKNVAIARAKPMPMFGTSIQPQPWMRHTDPVHAINWEARPHSVPLNFRPSRMRTDLCDKP